MPPLDFIKMHGLGNDFVVVDGRASDVTLSGDSARALADRRAGVGCDQAILIEAPADGLAAAAMRIFNADGGEAEACGNAARCVAAWLMDESNSDHVAIETPAGIIDAHRAGDAVCVDMGRPRFDWRDIPLAAEADTLHLDVGRGPLRDACAVGMGNPHAVFFVEDAEAVDLETLGPAIERDKMFPNRTNVEAAQIRGPDEIRLRVWERGAGLTPACGSGACATLVAANRRGLTGRKADIVLDGGRLGVEWAEDDHVLLTGPAVISFTGQADIEALTDAGRAS